MFSGVKNKLQQWRQKKKSPKLMAFMSNDTIRQISTKNSNQLQNLNQECKTVIQQLIEQVAALSEIDEDTTAVTEKISSLEENLRTIEKGLKESEEFTTFLEFTALLSDQINQCSTDIEDLHKQASSLFKENKSLRTELQVVQDHYERFETRAVELEIQIDHLKFMQSLPNWKPFFDDAENPKKVDEEEKIEIKPKTTLPFLEEDDSIDYAGSYILSVLDTLNVPDKRLKILFELIKSYIQNQAYDIAIPLLKTTVEDLMSRYDPHEKIVFTMMGIMVIVYNVTKRFKNAIDVQEDILEIRNDTMTEDKIGLAKTLSSLAVLNGKSGKIKVARNFCRQALDLKIKIHGESDIETAKDLHNLGILYSSDGKYPKAIDCLVKAMKIFQSSKKKTIFWFARGSANLASVWVEYDNLPEAKHLFLSVLKTLQNHLDKILEGKNVSKEDILEDESKIEEIPNCVNKPEIIRIVKLTEEVKRKVNSLSHVKLNLNKKSEEKNGQKISDED